MGEQNENEQKLTLSEALALGVKLHQDGRLSEAESIYRQILQAAPEQPDALHFLGLLSYQLGRGQEAIALIKKAVELAPNHADALNNLGNVLKEQNHLKEAAVAFRRVIALEPNHVAAQNNLGVVLNVLGDFSTAVTAYERAIALEPGHVEAHYNLGNALLNAGRVAEAMEAYQKVIALKPDYIEAYCSLGHIHHDQGRAEEAEAAFRQATLLKTTQAAAAYENGNALRGRGLIEEAIQAYRNALRLNPKLESAYKNLATVLNLLKRTEEAVAIWERWREHDPQNPIPRHMLAATTGQNVPPRAEDSFVTKLFDGFAETFDDRLKCLQYRAPDLIAEAVAKAIGPPRANLDVLDAGCGTGLCGPLLRPYARHLTGVDLSLGMVQKARARGAYDELITAELTEFLENAAGRWDLIASADTLVYFGDLAPVLAAAAAALRPGGCLAFTLEKMIPEDETAGFLLHGHGRYSHTAEYTRSSLAKAGFILLELSEAELRIELGEPVAGYVVVAQTYGSSRGNRES